MQLITNVSKYFILALLSLSLLTAWDTGVTDPVSFGSLYTEKVQNVKKNVKVKKITVTNVQKISSTIASNSVWYSIRSDLNLDHKTQYARVQSEIRKILKEPAKLQQILKAAVPYIYFIHKQTQAKGLPGELALIPVIESEFNPNDRSHRGATGLWQLMPGTARELGIKVRSGYDGRKNVVESTRAALAYLYDLGNLFKGNWYLALAAYNCGQVKVASVSRRAGSKNYWSLPLPRETKSYVPKLLAIAAIIKDPGKYGVKLPSINNEPYFKEVKFKKIVTLNNVAKKSGVSIATLHQLNPDYKFAKTLQKQKGSYSLLVPVKHIATIQSQFADKFI